MQIHRAKPSWDARSYEFDHVKCDYWVDSPGDVQTWRTWYEHTHKSVALVGPNHQLDWFQDKDQAVESL
jgi:hypothetical protein